MQRVSCSVHRVHIVRDAAYTHHATCNVQHTHNVRACVQHALAAYMRHAACAMRRALSMRASGRACRHAPARAVTSCMQHFAHIAWSARCSARASRARACRSSVHGALCARFAVEAAGVLTLSERTVGLESTGVLTCTTRVLTSTRRPLHRPWRGAAPCSVRARPRPIRLRARPRGRRSRVQRCGARRAPAGGAGAEPRPRRRARAHQRARRGRVGRSRRCAAAALLRRVRCCSVPCAIGHAVARLVLGCVLASKRAPPRAANAARALTCCVFRCSRCGVDAARVRGRPEDDQRGDGA